MISYFLGDIGFEQSRSEARIFGLFYDQSCRGANRQLIELTRSGAVEEAANGFHGDSHDVDIRQSRGATAHGPYDLINVYGFKRTVAFADVHSADGSALGPAFVKGRLLGKRRLRFFY